MKVLPQTMSMLLCATCLVATPGVGALEIRLADGIEVPVNVSGVHGAPVLLWLPSGIPGAGAEAEAGLAEKLRRQGIEVWRADILAARFLPTLESSLEQVADDDVVSLIEAAGTGGRRVSLLASARAGILALRGARAWQAKHPGSRGLDGAILLHPNLYLGPPEPGREAEFHPVVGDTQLAVHIIQPELSPWRFRFDALQQALRQGGATVTLQFLPGVRDRYYFRSDATPAEDLETAQLPVRVRHAMDLLHKRAAPLAAATPSAPSPARAAPVARGLHPYRGDPRPPRLQLSGIDGHPRDLAQLRGRVVLVNFWASWCPPCVREMPSMQRLQDKLGARGFTVLAVNLAEPDPTVRAFLERLKLSMTVLMDRDGVALKDWKVFVYPTSFVLDAEGQIRLGVFGEVEWDSPDVLEKIVALLPAQR